MSQSKETGVSRFLSIKVSADWSLLTMQKRVRSTVLVVNSEFYKLYVRGMGGIAMAACLPFSLIEVNYGKAVKESCGEKLRED